MKTITATELARNLRQVLDRLVIEGEEIVVETEPRTSRASSSRPGAADCA